MNEPTDAGTLTTAERLTCTADRIREDIEARNDLIVLRAGEGATNRQIAREARMSHPAIALILKKNGN
jgi:hypothetical protein